MSFSSIRRAARGIRYTTISELLGREVTFTSRQSIVTESLLLVQELFTSSTFISPEQKNIDGQIAKYGILDLTFAVDQSLLHDCASGVPVLRELGLVGNPAAYEDLDLDDDDDIFSPMSGVNMVLEDLEESQALLKLFLKAAVETKSGMRTTMRRLMVPDLLEFPMRFVINDACITNVSSAWIGKHFYL